MRGLSYGLFAVVTATTMFACGGGDVTTPPPNVPTPAGSSTNAPVASTAVTPPSGTAATVAPPTTAQTAPTPPPMNAIRGSTMQKDLEAIGLDVKKLPTLAKMDQVKKHKVMNTFTKALGVKCTGCHTENFKAETPHKKVARKMWDQWVVGLAMEDGTLLYCDSCHQGHDEFLDKRDKKALSTWMADNFVAKLKRNDKKEQECASCHGDPFVAEFLGSWHK